MRTLGLIALIWVLAACGGDDEAGGDGSAAGDGGNEAALPACSDVWVDGQTLPEDYEGCTNDDGSMEAAVLTDCDSGDDTFVTYQDEFFAVLGGEIAKAPSDSKAYAEAFEECFAG